jgi:hypothetical protein
MLTGVSRWTFLGGGGILAILTSIFDFLLRDLIRPLALLAELVAAVYLPALANTMAFFSVFYLLTTSWID